MQRGIYNGSWVEVVRGLYESEAFQHPMVPNAWFSPREELVTITWD